MASAPSPVMWSPTLSRKMASNTCTGTSTQTASTQVYVQKNAAPHLFPAAVRFSRDELGLTDEFYVDTEIVVRVNYPYEIARKAGVRLADFTQRVSTPKDRAKKAIRSAVGAVASRVGLRVTDPSSSRADNITSYHRNLPMAAWSHGAHVDTWYGHSYDGINFWWTLSGVQETNGMALYPDTFGLSLPHMEEPVYLLPGFPVPKPHKVEMPKDSMLMFNPETLHSTHLNITDKTRVVMTMRVNPTSKPVFNAQIQRHHATWLSASQIDRGELNKPSFVPKAGNTGMSDRKSAMTYVAEQKTIYLRGNQAQKSPIHLCKEDDIPFAKPVRLIGDGGLDIVIVKSTSGISAFNGKCPHLGVSLADGYVNGDTITCPGHGVTFNLPNGETDCAILKLVRSRVAVRDGNVYLDPTT